MGKQIFVMMCAINLDNQRKLLEGMIEAAKETDSNLYVFANYVSYKDKKEHIEGSYHIMHLPDFEQFDGVIFARNTIQHAPTAEYVQEKIRESGIAAVSIDLELPGMSCFNVSSYEAEFAMVEHFILGHEAGDNLIREMAEAVKMAVNDDRIGMRYGGDEFVMFGRCKAGESEESIIGELRANMHTRNEESCYPFKLSASLGVSIYEAKEVDKLEKLVELADQKMYEEKRKKREARNKTNG